MVMFLAILVTLISNNGVTHSMTTSETADATNVTTQEPVNTTITSTTTTTTTTTTLAPTTTEPPTTTTTTKPPTTTTTTKSPTTTTELPTTQPNETTAVVDTTNATTTTAIPTTEPTTTQPTTLPTTSSTSAPTTTPTTTSPAISTSSGEDHTTATPDVDGIPVAAIAGGAAAGVVLIIVVVVIVVVVKKHGAGSSHQDTEADTDLKVNNLYSEEKLIGEDKRPAPHENTVRNVYFQPLGDEEDDATPDVSNGHTPGDAADQDKALKQDTAKDTDPAVVKRHKPDVVPFKPRSDIISMGPIMLDEASPSTQGTFDKMYTTSSFGNS